MLQVVAGWSSVIISAVSYIPYFRDIYLGKTKPHAFSWLVWSLLGGTIFAIQLSEGGGYGSWVNGFAAFACILVFICSLFRGERHITVSDCVSLGGALIAYGLWLIANQPLLSVVLLTFVDALGFLPTYRKSYYKPQEETASMYVVGTLKYALSIIALGELHAVNLLYPVFLVIANGAFAMMLLIRRKQLSV